MVEEPKLYPQPRLAARPIIPGLLSVACISCHDPTLSPSVMIVLFLVHFCCTFSHIWVISLPGVVQPAVPFPQSKTGDRKKERKKEEEKVKMETEEVFFFSVRAMFSGRRSFLICDHPQASACPPAPPQASLSECEWRTRASTPSQLLLIGLFQQH